MGSYDGDENGQNGHLAANEQEKLLVITG